MAQEPRFSDLVVIAASAGGIEALSTLVATLPTDFPAPILLAQHLDPTRESHLDEILARRSTLPVRIVTDHTPLEAGVVFVIPPNRHVELADHYVRLIDPHGGSGPAPSVDLLLRSAAGAYGEGLIAVILTGMGSDGTAGARDVKQAGGTVVIQNPETARFPSMPFSLPPTIVDVVANTSAMGPLLRDLLTGAYTPSQPGEDRVLRSFLDQLRESSGIDFNSYKSTTIMRRLQRRMATSGAQNLEEYIELLARRPEEYQRLISSFLIKVTEFFRDADLFDYLRDHVIPDLIRYAETRDHELRIWSAGCATGEEPYSLAILVSEALGDRHDDLSVRIFATDLDADAVAFARRGVYASAALGAMPQELIDKYFRPSNGDFEVDKRVRNLIVFGQHDLAQRAPFPRVDLTLCRNVLIYFTPELQKRALQLFAFSLRDRGYLVLGKAETTSPLAEHFVAENVSLKIYRRGGERLLLIPPTQTVGLPGLRPRVALGRRSAPEAAAAQPPPAPGLFATFERGDSLLMRLPIGVVVVDRHYDIQIINGAARRMLGIHGTAIGEDLVHMARSVPPGELRRAIDAAYATSELTTLDEIAAMDMGTAATRYMRLTCMPYTAETPAGMVQAALIALIDMTDEVARRRELADAHETQSAEVDRISGQARQLAEANRELLRANQDLADSNSELRGTNEDFLVGNEELQAAAEEVETLNEELQATNEELETLNEELQATVEELNTTNEDLQARSQELQDLAASLEAQRHMSDVERERLSTILVSMADAVLAVDRNGRTILRNEAYTTLFGDEAAGFVPLDDAGNPLPDAEWPQQRAARGETFNMQFVVTGTDGGLRWFEANGQPSAGAQGGGVVVIRNITDRSLRHLAEQLLAITSHELRTPLTGLMGYLQLLSRSLRDPTTSQQHLTEEALREARRLRDLIADLTDVGRLQGGNLTLHLEQVNLAELARHAVEVTQVQARDRQQIVLDVQAEPIVQADPRRIEQVLLNLLTNAMTYAPESERIDVRVRVADAHAEAEVEDFGPGIPAADLPQIFSEFYRVMRPERGHSGLGLGLYISREIVVAHGGSLDVRSIEGQGTTFTMRLPMTTAPGN
ncbi:MAG: two-component system, chemotaxis family, CheB/CheR fusion protein [Chloroflexota bacterium]|nr:two-component system, chemotaxis family, CheB/CheR fusion protein [Chloroflexota bacterium]